MDPIATLQEAIRAIEYAQTEIETSYSLGPSKAALDRLYPAQASLSGAKSRLRDLLKSKEHGSPSPQGSDRPKPARRKMVVSNLQRVSSIRSRERKGQPRKRLSRKQANAHWYPTGDPSDD